MKITIDVDCTPEEARAFLGLPDVGPMQARMMEEFETRLRAAMTAMDPQELMKHWFAGVTGAGGAEALAGWQKSFWDQFGGGKGSAGGNKSTDK